MGLLSVLQQALMGGQPNQMAQQPAQQANMFAPPTLSNPNAKPGGIFNTLLGMADTALQFQPQYREAALQRAQLQSANIENQNAPVFNALRNALLQQQGIKSGIENRYLPQGLQGDIDYKKALMSRVPYENALTQAQIGVANRSANAPYSNAGEIMSDYNRVVKQYGANSPEAQATANVIQASIKQQNAVMGMNEEGMPVAIGGGNPASGALAAALARVGNANYTPQVTQPGDQQQPSFSPANLPQSAAQPQAANAPSGNQPAVYLKSGMTGSAKGGAGATYVNPVTKETITSPTTADVSDMQERMRAIESVLPILEELKNHGKGSFGPPIIGDTGNAYTSSLDKGIDTYVVASNLPKTGEGIATARGVLQRGRTETEKHYLDRIDALKNDLTAKYSRYQDVLRRGYRSGDKASRPLQKAGNNDAGNVSILSDEDLLKALRSK